MSCSCGKRNSGHVEQIYVQLGNKPASRNLRYGYAKQVFRDAKYERNIIKGKYKNNYVSTCLYPRIAPSFDRYQHRGPFNIACVGTSLHKENYLT